MFKEKEEWSADRTVQSGVPKETTKNESTRTRKVVIAMTLWCTIYCSVAQAVFIQSPPTNWVFQNTNTIKATDFQVSVQFPPPNIDFDASSGGVPFPSKVVSGGDATYIAGPGIPAGGFYGHCFPGWPAGTMFGITFSYINNDAFDFVDPGRVYRQVGLGFNPEDFEYVAALSSEPFAPLPSNFVFSQSSGLTVAVVPEPMTICLLGLGGLALRRRRRAC